MATGERGRFLWAGRRMMIVLDRIEAFVSSRDEVSFPEMADYLLAISVVCGRAADWDNRLAGWFNQENAK